MFFKITSHILRNMHMVRAWWCFVVARWWLIFFPLFGIASLLLGNRIIIGQIYDYPNATGVTFTNMGKHIPLVYCECFILPQQNKAQQNMGISYEAYWAFGCYEICIWVRSRNCGCLVTWFCYQLIAKPGNKTATVPWPDPYGVVVFAVAVPSIFVDTWYSFTYILHLCSIDIGLVLGVLHHQWSNPEGYGQNQEINNDAKTQQNTCVHYF